MSRKLRMIIMTVETFLCWGLNDNGQLGDGSTTNRRVPVTVIGM